MSSSPKLASLPSASGSEGNFVLTIAGIRMGVSIPDADSRAEFLALMGNMACADSGSVDCRIEWDGPHGSVLPGSRRIESSTPQRIPALTLILLLERLQALLPDLLLLHGNAIFDTQQDRVILIVGASGYGKSTLSRELLSSARFKLLAEDTLLVRLDEGLLEPFPRSASLRVVDGEQSDQPRWKGLGRRREEKLLVPPGRVHLEPASLNDALVITLALPTTAQPAESVSPIESETFWLSHLDDQLSATVLEIHGENAAVRIPSHAEEAFPAVTFQKKLHGNSRSEFLDLLASHGAMILSTQIGSPKADLAPRQRGVAPVMASLSALDGLKSLTEMQVLFAAPDIKERDASRTIMQLGRTFSHAQFRRLIPGGTPTETAECIRQALDGGL